MKIRLSILCCLSLLFCNILIAQTKWEKCGHDIVKANMELKNPDFAKQLEARMKEMQVNGAKNKGAKTTLNVTVPVVFHVILNQAQMDNIGDSSGIAHRVLSQIDVLNDDYNRKNADSINIPDAFKGLYANVNIKFGLAHTDPNGNATDGWEILKTNLNGFDIYDQSGKAAKYNTTGGLDAWDVDKYLNIWVTNLLNGTSTTGVIGLTVPPSYADSAFTDPYPKNEVGVLLRYNAFGRRANAGENFYPAIDQGRTATHEIGHYFELAHPWGDDDSKCPWNGGTDDGIADTPPECDAQYHCPSFPTYDCCNSIHPGVMYMNYMDYTDDACMNMFSSGQAYKMNSDLSIGYTHSLIAHPDLLDYPGGTVPNFDYTYSIYPNPAIQGHTSLNFNQIPKGFESISLYNSIGQHLLDLNTANQVTTYYPIDLSGYGKGMYFIKVHFDKKTDIQKIIVL